MKRKLLLMTAISLGLIVSGCSTDQPEDTSESPSMEEEQTENEGESEGETEGETTDGEEVDSTTAASTFTDEETLIEAFGENGSWIILFEDDFTTDQEIVLEGEHTNRDEVERKIALYTQDEERNKEEEFTFTAPKLTIKSENSRLVGGTFEGDIYVEVEEFLVDDATVKGDIYFAEESMKESFQTENDAVIEGDLIVN